MDKLNPPIHCRCHPLQIYLCKYAKIHQLPSSCGKTVVSGLPSPPLSISVANILPNTIPQWSHSAPIPTCVGFMWSPSTPQFFKIFYDFHYPLYSCKTLPSFVEMLHPIALRYFDANTPSAWLLIRNIVIN